MDRWWNASTAPSHRTLPPLRTVRLGSRAYLFPLLALVYLPLFLGALGMDTVMFALIVAVSLLFGVGLLMLARRSDERLRLATAERPTSSSLVYPLLVGFFLLLLGPAVGAFFEAEDAKDRVPPLMFLLLLASGVVLSAGRGAPAKALGYGLLVAPMLVGLAFDAQSLSEILKLPVARWLR